MIPLWLLLSVAAPDTGDVSAALHRAVESGVHPRMRWGDISDVRDAVAETYARHAWRPLWAIAGSATRAANGVLRELDSARARGLHPVDYDVESLHRAQESLALLDPGNAAEFDVMLSVAAARYALALNRGRIDAHVLHPLLAASPDSIDIPGALEQLALTARPDTMFRALEPSHATYQQLITLLAKYRTMADRSRAPADDSTAGRIHQIELALERWRWLPHSAEAPWIVVNIPAFRLYAMASDREEYGDMLQMPIVAGQSALHPTPVLVTRIVGVQFHPPWLVPESIAAREIRPLALRDSGYLAAQHFELVRGDSIVPASRTNILRIGAGIDVRQTPGRWNALGSIKFVTPNDADVYLHDTPERRDFQRTPRDFSHGCIRVAAPVSLAEFALRREPGWSPDRIADVLADTSTLMVPLRAPIPVFVMYQTIVPAESGGVLAYPDIYGFDKRLDALLRGGYPYRTPLIP